MDTKTETAGRGKQPRPAAKTEKQEKEVKKNIPPNGSKVKKKDKAVSGENGNGALKPDSAAAIDFLKHFHPTFAVVLTAIDPESGKLTGATFKAKDVDTTGKKWIEARNNKQNLYFSVNPVKGPVKDKASKPDVHSLAYLHVDCDPEKGKPINAEQKRILTMLTEFTPKATAITFSGGGYQAFWKLKEPVVIKNLKHAEELEGYNKQLEKVFDSDHTHNIDRIMRIPDTVNKPNKKKREAGRKPALAVLIESDWTRVYELEKDFKRVFGTFRKLIPE